jgi:1-acyl-sn-glycerol-3-phosphate acyltransferase
MAEIVRTIFPTNLAGYFVKRTWIQCLEGLENIPSNRSCIVIANHASYMDFLLLGTVFEYVLRRRLHFWAKTKVTTHPFFRIFAKYSRAIEIAPRGRSTEFWVISRRFLSQGDSVGIFPEGTRTRTGALGRFNRGYLRLANATQAPVVPAVITNTYRMLPPGSRIPGRAKSRIHFYPPVWLERECSKEELESLNERIFVAYYRDNNLLAPHVDTKTH